jgi:hypothetical protein
MLMPYLCSSALAQDRAGGKRGAPTAPEDSVTQISPIFGQLVLLAFPKGFTTVFERTNGNGYIRESVLAGETVDHWSQMITVTGAKGLAANQSVTAQLLVNQIAAGFKRACPETLSAKGLGAMKISGQDAFAGLVGCGTVLTTIEKHSESALLIAIKGTADYYTVQWAERGPASGEPIGLAEAKWTDRFKKLNPIKLCPLVPGEAPPYPSCLNQ